MGRYLQIVDEAVSFAELKALAQKEKESKPSSTAGVASQSLETAQKASEKQAEETPAVQPVEKPTSPEVTAEPKKDEFANSKKLAHLLPPDYEKRFAALMGKKTPMKTDKPTLKPCIGPLCSQSGNPKMVDRSKGHVCPECRGALSSHGYQRMDKPTFSAAPGDAEHSHSVTN